MISAEINGIKLSFNTNKNLFSPQSIDKGTLAMLHHAKITSDMKVLDLGCGYGAVGIYAASIVGCSNVLLTDVDSQAVALAQQNAALNGLGELNAVQSDGFKNIDDTGFDLILSNPPYHVDFKIPKEFIEKGFNRLKIGGKMIMVTKRKEWYKNKLTAIFGGVQIYESDGYFIFLSEKRQNHYAKNYQNKYR